MTAPLQINRAGMEDLALAGAENVAIRGVHFQLPTPRAEMRACIVVPARNEEVALPALLEALAKQRTVDGGHLEMPAYEVIVLLNNCSDRSGEIAAKFRRANRGRLALHVAEVIFEAEDAHVGRARQVLCDLALHRFESIGKRDGLILTTDADSRPASDWIAQNEREIADGADAVGGRICLESGELAELPREVRRYVLLDIGYRRALEEMRWLYAPEACDPFPRHHQHFGASLAVTAAAYRRAGGMPAHRSNEDVALYRAIVNSGGKFRHSYRVRVNTSARVSGRATGGLADALGWWLDHARRRMPVMVESAAAAEARLAELGLWKLEMPQVTPRPALLSPPEPPLANRSAEIQVTLNELRARCERLRAMPMAERMARATRICERTLETVQVGVID